MVIYKKTLYAKKANDQIYVIFIIIKTVNL